MKLITIYLYVIAWALLLISLFIFIFQEPIALYFKTLLSGLVILAANMVIKIITFKK